MNRLKRLIYAMRHRRTKDYTSTRGFSWQMPIYRSADEFKILYREYTDSFSVQITGR